MAYFLLNYVSNRPVHILSSKPARNMQRLIIEINEQKIVNLVVSYYRDISRCTVKKTLKIPTGLYIDRNLILLNVIQMNVSFQRVKVASYNMLHILKMFTLIPKQALRQRPKGRRNIGRPKKRWRDQLQFEDQGTGNTSNSSGT